MATISGLPAASALAGTEVAVVVQGGTDVKAAVQAIAASGAPRAHAPSHASGGTDQITVAVAQISGVLPVASGGTGASAKAAAFDALAPTSAKGDLPVHNGTNNIRVALGTDGQVLTADSSQTTGIKWATPTGGPGGQGLTPTAIKTAAYTAAVGDDVLADTRTATWSASLPLWSSTADGARCGFTDPFGGLGTGWVAHPLTVLRNGAPAIDGAAADASLTGGRHIEFVKSTAAGGWIVDSVQGAGGGGGSGTGINVVANLIGGIAGEVARTQISRNGDEVRITDVGGYPGGVLTVAAMAAAFTQAFADTGVVEVPPGSYPTNGFTISAGQVLHLWPGAQLQPVSAQVVTNNGQIIHYGGGIGGAGTVGGTGTITNLAASSAMAFQNNAVAAGSAGTLNVGSGGTVSVSGGVATLSISGGAATLAGMSMLQGNFGSSVANAVTYINGGSNRIVFVEPGNYSIGATQHLTSANHGFVGLGRIEDTFFNSSVANADTFWIDAAVDGSRWENISFGSSGSGGHCLAFRGGNTASPALTWVNEINIFNCNFNGFSGSATDVNGNTITPFAIYVWAGLDVIIDNVGVGGNKNGIMVGGVQGASQSNKVYMDRIVGDGVWYQGIAVVAGEGVTIHRTIFNHTGSGRNRGLSNSDGGIIVNTGVQVDITDTRLKGCSPCGIAIENSTGAAGGTIVRVSNCYFYIGPFPAHPDGSAAIANLDGIDLDSTHAKVIIENNHFDSIFNRNGGTDIKFIGRSGASATGYVFRDNYSPQNNNMVGKMDQAILISPGASICRQLRCEGNHIGCDVAVGGSGGFNNAAIILEGNAVGTTIKNNWMTMLGSATSPYGFRQRTDGASQTPTLTKEANNFYFGFSTAGRSIGNGTSTQTEADI